MFFQSALDLTDVIWKATLYDGTIIPQGPQKYPIIPRDKLESFELLYKGKQIFKVNPAKKTLIHRLKTKNQTVIGEKTTSKIIQRIRVTALLQKNKDPSKNIKTEIFENKKLVQEYTYDPELSTIYYHYANKKMETKNKFSKMSPYHPIKLRQEELNHLNG